MIYCSFSFIYSYCPHISFEEMHYLFVVQPQWYDRSLPLSPCSPELCVLTAVLSPLHFSGGGGPVGAGIYGALLPGNAGRRGQGLVHPIAWPQQPGGGPAAAAAQQPVCQRSPQQLWGSGSKLNFFFFYETIDLSYNQVHLKKHFF